MTRGKLINFISSIDNDEERVMHSKTDNKEIMINDEADEDIKELFKSLKNRYQIIWNQWKVMILSSIRLIYCIINVIK